jgi:hypothetical protein
VQRWARWKCALAVTLPLAVLGACSNAEPTLPSSSNPAAVHQILAGPDGPAFLNEISTYDWPDDGAKAGEYFVWIGRDATSTDPSTATLAGESAHSLADYLAGRRGELTSISHGFLGLAHSPIGEMNPKLVAAFAAALTPYQGAMAGNDDGVRGFGRLGDSAGDFSSARSIFAVLATEPDSGARFVESAYDRAIQVVTDTAKAGCTSRTVAETVGPAAIREAATLSGLAASTTDQDGDVATKERHQAMDDLVHAIAATCIGLENGPLEGSIDKYVEGGTLMSPPTAKRLNQGLEDYYQSQRDYIAARGFSTADFSEWYNVAAGEKR